MTLRRRFWHVAGAGAAFQAGSAAVDSATVMSALVFQLIGSPVAVGTVSTILRFGWLLPQLFVGYLSGRSGSSMPFYVLGAFGRTTAIAALAGVLWTGASAGWSSAALGAVTLCLWAVYACLSGIVGVPYNDIVARSVPSGQRSRLLAVRFFGGGLVALLVAAVADRLIRALEFPVSYAAVLGIAAVLMLMEISPDDRRPAYSGYFNALTAPAFLLPIIGGFTVAALDTWIVFLIALAAALGQSLLLARIKAGQSGGGP